MVSVITRSCPVPICPAASAAAVAGSVGARVSPVRVRWVPTMAACSARVRASLAESRSIPASSRAVLPKPFRTAVPRESSSATSVSISECVWRDNTSTSRSVWVSSWSSRPLSVPRTLSRQSDIVCTGSHRVTVTL
jgi:hypothetical protein